MNLSAQRIPSAALVSTLPHLRLRRGRLLILAGVVAVAFLAVLAWGSVRVPLEDILRVLTGGEAAKESWTTIILKIRLPRALTALLAGGALGLAGLLMQTYFRNPLAGPYVLGVSSGASLGVALVVLGAGGSFLTSMGLGGDVLIAAAAAAGAGLTLLIILAVATRVDSTLTLLILGVMLGALTSAVVSLLMHFSIPERIQAFVNWTFGSFNGVTWAQMPVLAAGVVVGMTLALTLRKSLNALLLGEAYAASMGLNTTAARAATIGATALLAGVVTAFCGPIGFIGTAVPHVCRAIFNTSDHATLVPACVLTGGLVGLASALLAELPGSTLVLPLNAVTAVLGAPVVIFVLLRQRNLGKAFGG